MSECLPRLASRPKIACALAFASLHPMLGHTYVEYPSDTRYKAFCVSNAFIANAKRGAKRVYYKRKTRVNAEQNACKHGAKRVYYKRKTRLIAMPNALAGNTLCETHSTRKLEGQGPRVWLTRVTSAFSNFAQGD